jgi:hypothetical protein
MLNVIPVACILFDIHLDNKGGDEVQSKSSLVVRIIKGADSFPYSGENKHMMDDAL